MATEIKLGPAVGRFDRKYDHEAFPRPGGVNTQGDPASMGPEQFWKLINARWFKDGCAPRGGYGSVLANPLHDAAASVFPANFQVSTPFRCWYVGSGFPCESAVTGRFIGFYDPEASPWLQRVAWYDPADEISIGSLGNTPYVGVDGKLKRLNLLQAPFGIDQSALAGVSTDVPIAEWAGEDIKLLAQFDGMLFVLLDAGTPHVVTYDGLTIREDKDFGAAPVAAGLYRDQLLVGLDDGKVYSRTAGDSPGSWTLLGTVSGSSVKPGLNTIVSHKDVAYILNGQDDIHTWNGAAFANTHTIGGGELIKCLAEGLGYLFYGYTGGGAAFVGRFDASGPTWVDAHKRLTDDDANIDNISAMTFYKNELIAMVNAAADTAQMATTVSRATSGTWVYTDLSFFWQGTYVGVVPYLVTI